MVHALDAAYFSKRATQSRSAALTAADVSSRTAHQQLCAAYEVRATEARAASEVNARSRVRELFSVGQVLGSRSWR